MHTKKETDIALGEGGHYKFENSISFPIVTSDFYWYQLDITHMLFQ